eukprot:gene8957-12078_t
MTHYLFSYGSNSISQLQARVHNPLLTSIPAKAMDWTRIFCMHSYGWGGAAASIYPLKGESVYGSLTLLNQLELDHLDHYEGGYHKQELTVQVLSSNRQDWESINAISYIANNPTYITNPSDSYLTAIYVMLREQYKIIQPSVLDSIDICGISSSNNDSITKYGTWTFPGRENLEIEPLIVEINSCKIKKWIMPLTINSARNELNEIGVTNARQLRQLVFDDEKLELFLTSSTVFDDESIIILKDFFNSSNKELDLNDDVRSVVISTHSS